MSEISVFSFEGKEFSGYWNEKIYSSQIDGKSELLRIYIDGKVLHITPEEYMRITNKTSEEYKKKEFQDKILSRRESVKTMSLQEKVDILTTILVNESVSLKKNNLIDIVCRLLTMNSNIKSLAESQHTSVEKLVEDVMSALIDTLKIIQQETNTKEIKVQNNESLESVMKRILMYSFEPETYTAKYNNVLLDSKEITERNAYKLVYGISQKEWEKQNGGN